jgi:hypothetical protein
MPGDKAWSFELRVGEGKCDRWWRLFDELLAAGFISISVRGEILAAFLDVVSAEGEPIAFIAGKPVTHVESWRTNCAMTQHAAMVWCKRKLRPYVNAEPIQGGEHSYIELAKGDRYWRPNDGILVPNGPAIFYVEPSAHLAFEHVGAFGRQVDTRTYATYEGGGGDGTRIGKSTRVLDQPDTWGRHLTGWWEIDELLPASADLASGEVVRDAVPPESAPT